MAKTKVKDAKKPTDALRKRALDLRLEGMSYPAIGVKLGLEHPWAAAMSALGKLDESERKKVQAQLEKIGVQRAPSSVAAKIEKSKTAKAPKLAKVKAVKQPKAAKPKGAPSRVKNGTDKAQLHDAELAAEVDAKREQSPLNMTRAERERAVKDGKLPTADLATLAAMPNNGRDFKPVPKTVGERIDNKKGAVAAQ